MPRAREKCIQDFVCWGKENCCGKSVFGKSLFVKNSLHLDFKFEAKSEISKKTIPALKKFSDFVQDIYMNHTRKGNIRLLSGIVFQRFSYLNP